MKEILKFFADGSAWRPALSSAVSNIPADNNNVSVKPILYWIYALAGMVAAGFIIMGAISYASAQGDSGKIAKAKGTIIAAIIGLILVMMAAAITSLAASVVE